MQQNLAKTENSRNVEIKVFWKLQSSVAEHKNHKLPNYSSKQTLERMTNGELAWAAISSHNRPLERNHKLKNKTKRWWAVLMSTITSWELGQENCIAMHVGLNSMSKVQLLFPYCQLQREFYSLIRFKDVKNAPDLCETWKIWKYVLQKWKKMVWKWHT